MLTIVKILLIFGGLVSLSFVIFLCLLVKAAQERWREGGRINNEDNKEK